MVAIGCGIDEYIALNPAFKGNRGVAGVAAGGAVPLLPPPLPPATTWSTAALLWFRNFSSRRHFALRLLNHTCNRHNDGAFVTISVQPHTRRRRHGISHHPHSSAFALVRARSRSTTLFCFLSEENSPSPSPPYCLTLSPSLSPFFLPLYSTEPLVYSRGSAKSNTQTLFSHLVRTDSASLHETLLQFVNYDWAVVRREIELLLLAWPFPVQHHSLRSLAHPLYMFLPTAPSLSRIYTRLFSSFLIVLQIAPRKSVL